MAAGCPTLPAKLTSSRIAQIESHDFALWHTWCEAEAPLIQR